MAFPPAQLPTRTPRTDESWTTRPYGRLIEASAWVAAALTTAWAGSLAGADLACWPAAAVSVLAWLFGTRVFLHHGGTQLTAAGIFSYAFALFIGGSGVYYTVAEPVAPAMRPWLLLAVTTGYLTQVATVFSCWTTWRSPPAQLGAFSVTRRSRTAGVYLGAVLLAGALTAKTAGVFAAETIGVALTAVVLIAASLVLSGRARVLSLRSALIAALAAVFVGYFHSGTGRLHIATLAFAVAILYALRFRHIAAKLAVVAGTAPAVWWAARYREEYVRAAYGSDVNGLGSAVRPVWAYAKLLAADHHHAYPLAWGKTLITPLTSFLPSWLAPGKPMAFGYAMAAVTEPDKFGSGYSDAGSIFGEFVWNFSLAGLALMIPVIGLTIRWWDQALPSALRDPRGAVLCVTAAAIICGGVSDLMWGGVHTYLVRTAVRLAVLAPLIVIARLQRTRDPK